MYAGGKSCKLYSWFKAVVITCKLVKDLPRCFVELANAHGGQQNQHLFRDMLGLLSTRLFTVIDA